MRHDIRRGNDCDYQSSAVDYQLSSAYSYQEARENRDDGYHSHARVCFAAGSYTAGWAREAMGITDSDQEYA